MESLPKRKHLKRIPVWLPLESPVIYFVTVCCLDRQPAFSSARTVILAAECLQRMASRLKWDVLQVCFMPDHVHVLLSPTEDREQTLSLFIQRWKTCVTQRLGKTIWQREFFDHLIRKDEKLEEKWEYVRQNPVRAGLCGTAEEYPYSGTIDEVLSRLSGFRKEVE